MTREDRKLLEQLREMFGRTWFTAKLARVSIDQLKELAKKGYLESGKAVACSTINFKIKDR